MLFRSYFFCLGICLGLCVHPNPVQAQVSALVIPERLAATGDAIIDAAAPSINFAGWSTPSGEPLLTTNATKTVLLNWTFTLPDTTAIVGDGTLEVYTHSLLRLPNYPSGSGLIRVFEIQANMPWADSTVTYSSFTASPDLVEAGVLTPVATSDVVPSSRVRTTIAIPEAVLLRLRTGQSSGLALQAVGPISISLYSRKAYAGLYAARLAFSVQN